MDILLFQWKAYNNVFLEKNLREMGHTVHVWFHEGVQEDDENCLSDVQEKVKEGFDIAFSYNYFGYLAIACHQADIPYVSWMQDAPLLSLYHNSSVFETNYFFCFDSEQYRNLMMRGLPHVYYLPLGVDLHAMEETAGTASREEQERYRADVSFVGSLYSNRNIFGRIESSLPAYVRGYLDSFSQMQMLIPQIRFSKMGKEDKCHLMLKQNLKFPDAEQYALHYDELVDNLIDRHVTVMERRKMLEICQEVEGFKLYTNTQTTEFPGIQNCGEVDYYTEMPKVFRYSRINLNVSLRSIRYGIPLRVLDVIASGGFVLTNAQPDIFLYFEDGKNIVTFQNLSDMKEKIDYYLKHEEERKEIIRAGRDVLQNCFDFKVLLSEIFQKL